MIPDTDISDFADKVNEIMPSVIKGFARLQANELYKGKISLPQFLILDFLSKPPHINMCGGKEACVKMTDIARFMGVSTPATTGIVERLVRDKYVVREYDNQDRRIIKIKITAKGLELVRRVNLQRRQMVIRIFGRISERERGDYLNILRHIHNILLEEKNRSSK